MASEKSTNPVKFIEFISKASDTLGDYSPSTWLDIYKVHSPTNALEKLEKSLKFTLKITLVCSYMFRTTTIIREPSLEPG